MGDKAWCISYKDSACRCFGFLVSKKRYIYTIDDDCFVAKDPSNEVGCRAASWQLAQQMQRPTTCAAPKHKAAGCDLPCVTGVTRVPQQATSRAS